MAITTASNIVTIAFNREVDKALIMQSDIEAAEWKYIRGALMLHYQINGEAIFEAIIADMGESGEFYTVGGYLKTALAYYVAANVFGRIGSGVESRGVFDYTTPNAQKAQPDTQAKIKGEYMTMASLNFDKALNWINENMDDDYGDVPETNLFDWVSGVGYDTARPKRVNVA